LRVFKARERRGFGAGMEDFRRAGTGFEKIPGTVDGRW
jgi:hypothetical protein